MKKVLYKLFYNLHPYFSVPPYNVFWSKYLKKINLDFIKNDPINIVDVGGRFGELPELSELTRYVNYFTFDADSEEAARLENELKTKDFNSVKVFDNLVYSKAQLMSFYLYKSPGDSSLYLPNKRYQEYYGDTFDIAREVKLQAVTIDSLSEQKSLPDIDLFKLDTQGSELDILKGAEKAIGLLKPVMIEVEVEFFEMYEGQPLFHDVSSWLHANGYELLYINRVQMNRKNFRGISRGQLIFGDALFGIKNVEVLSVSKKIKYILLLINYGLIDLAFDIFTDDEKLRTSNPELQKFFLEKDKSANILRLLKTAILDNLLFRYLKNRKTNGLKYDSDRSYPVR